MGVGTMNLKERQKMEAIYRLQILNMQQDVIKEFVEENKIKCSINSDLKEFLIPDLNYIIKKFEKYNNYLVYHSIFSVTKVEKTLSLLYVSKHFNEWEMDIQYLLNNTPIVYIENLNNAFCSKFDFIKIKPLNNTLIRID